MRYALLGPVEVRDDTGRPVEVGGARLLALVARLALDPGRTVTVDALVDGLWGEAPPAGAVNALQSLVSRLRRALGPHARIESGPAGYRLVADPADVDTVRFEQLAGAGHRALAAGSPAEAADLLTRALGLWRGPALAGVADAPFAAAPVTRLTERRSVAEEDRFAAALALGGHAEILAELTALAEAHPMRDRLSALLVTTLYRAGRQADALAAYDRSRVALRDELGADPGPDLAAAHRVVLQGEPAAAPPPVGSTGNLRAQLTSFVGRDGAMADVDRLLTDGRLLTLIGPGGSGKTRLAVESAGRLAARLTDGVWLVELAGVLDPAEVPAAVLAAVAPDSPLLAGASAMSTLGTTQRLVHLLRTRRLLLVLDNCEHLIDAAAALAATVLADCPRVQVLATSREPLGITGEALLPVSPLGLPPAGATAAEALPTAAVRLFVDRAAAVRAGFRLDGGNGTAVVEICRRLDGLPLAIELAAARMRTLTAGQLAARLDDRFRLLTGGSRVALARHRTLRAVVEWSWDLLTGPEARLAARLSVFAGGAPLVAVEQVCGPPDRTLDLLAALVDKSLVVIGTGDDGEPRYRMLETIRAYAAERLTDPGPVRRAHAAYHLALAERAEPHLRGADQIRWLAVLTEEYDNIVAALRYTMEVGEADTAVRFVVALGWFWAIRGDLATTMPLVREALAVPGGTETPARRLASALLIFAEFGAWSEGHQDKDELRRVMAVLGEEDPRAGHPLLGLIEPMAGVLTEDNAAALRAVNRRIDHPDPWVRAVSLVLRGHLRLNDGEIAEVEADHTRALELFMSVGDRWGQSASATSVAELRELRGDRAGAVAAMEESLRLVLELGAADEILEARVRLAQQRARAGDPAGAIAELVELHSRAERRGSPQMLLFAELAAGEAALIGGDVTAAATWYEQAEISCATANGPPQIRTVLRVGQGLVLAVGDDPGAAMVLYRQALDDAVAGRDRPMMAMVADAMGHAVAEVDPDRSAFLFGVAAGLRGIDDHGHPLLAAARERVRERLGPQDWAAAYERGAGLDHVSALDQLSG